MILGIDGKRIAGVRRISDRECEVVRSFSYKLNLKMPDGSPAYEDCQFFCSKKDYCEPSDSAEMARELVEFCMDQVEQDIREFQERRARKQAVRAQRSAA